MQIILASAKIMNDRLRSVPDISLSTPRFLNEADADDGILIHLATEEYQHLFD